jgi:hypothetical protein
MPSLVLRRMTFLRMILAAFAVLYLAASASAAVTCALPEMNMPACGKATSDCPDHKGYDCQLACGTMCAAVEPSATPAAVAMPTAEAFAGGRLLELPASFSGPEPPPPRMG